MDKITNNDIVDNINHIILYERETISGVLRILIHSFIKTLRQPLLFDYDNLLYFILQNKIHSVNSFDPMQLFL